MVGTTGTGKTTTLATISGHLRPENRKIKNLTRKGNNQILIIRKINLQQGTTLVVVKQIDNMALQIAYYGYNRYGRRS